MARSQIRILIKELPPAPNALKTKIKTLISKSQSLDLHKPHADVKLTSNGCSRGGLENLENLETLENLELRRHLWKRTSPRTLAEERSRSSRVTGFKTHQGSGGSIQGRTPRLEIQSFLP